MKNGGFINGFSKLNRQEKIELASGFAGNPVEFAQGLYDHLHRDPAVQALYDAFTENALSNFYLPYSVVPNFLINDRFYLVPMVTEESSVVAAAAAAAKFWAVHGGFHTRVIGMKKPGHIHFLWKGSHEQLSGFISAITPGLLESVRPIAGNMTRRGGGILDIHLKDLSDRIGRYYQLEVIFNTVDSMGANFINSCLERMAEYFQHQAVIHNVAQNLEIIMSILSNYTPECLVECTVSCPITDLDQQPAGISGPDFARRFGIAVDMAHHDVYRAATHNKGIYNGIDAVMLATGNDSRAAEASGHSYASAGGMYRGLTHARISGDTFTFSLKMPLPLGTVGGITRTHPMAEISLSLLQYPDAEKLMGIAAAAGLANNYSAVRALVTSGIQHGHMRLHLTNLLIHLGASEQEMTGAREFFRHRIVTHAGVEDFLRDLRKKSQGWSQE